MFDAVILAGGFGTRLKSVSGDIPKPMVDVAGKPFLYRLMERLEAQGCERIILSLGYRANYIVKRIINENPVSCEVLFSVEDKPLDTGGAIKKAASLISRNKFVVLNGDSYSDICYKDFFLHASDTDLLISGVQISDVSRYGTLEFYSDYRVTGLFEKGKSGAGTINSGIYVVKREDLLSFPADIFSFESDFVKSYRGSFFAYVNDNFFIDIGIPEDYYKACEYFS